jgi:hypothetical protein
MKPKGSISHMLRTRLIALSACLQSCCQGLAYYSDWGTLRNTGNMMFLAALMGKHGDNKEAHICWARSQMRYILGSR